MSAALLRLAIASVLVGGSTSEPNVAAPESESDAVRSVTITLAAASSAGTRLEQRLREFLGPLPARFAIGSTVGFTAAEVIDDQAGTAFAKVWIDAAAADHVRIYIVDRDADRILIRKVQTPAGLDEVAIEEIAYIVEASVDAMLRGGTIGITRVEAAAELGVQELPRAPPPAAPIPVAVRRRWAIGIAASYLARAWGRGAVQHGPAIELAFVRLTQRVAAGAAIEGAAIVPIRVRANDLELRLAGGGVRVLAHVDGALASRWRWDGRLGAGVDFVRDEGRPLAPSAIGSRARTRPIGVLALRTGPTVTIGRGRDRLIVRLHATLDIELAGVRYVTTEGAAMLEPWRVRPGAALTLGWRRETR